MFIGQVLKYFVERKKTDVSAPYIQKLHIKVVGILEQPTSNIVLIDMQNY